MRVVKGAFVFLLFFLVLFFSIFISLDQGEEPQTSDVIIVAGGSPNRTYKAADLLFEGWSTQDTVMESPITERIFQTYRYLGVPEESISLLEQEATSTWTNAVYSVDIMEEEGWTSAIVVTTDYHIKRTHLSYERAARGKDLDFTYVSSYPERDGESLEYMDYGAGRHSGRREVFKYWGYMIGLYHWIDL